MPENDRDSDATSPVDRGQPTGGGGTGTLHTGGLAVAGEGGTAGAGRTPGGGPSSTIAGKATGDKTERPPNMKVAPGMRRAPGVGSQDRPN
jgi:hypothetical protein